MKRISIPRKRAYYTATRGDPDELLCWIPPDELVCMAKEGRIRSDVPGDYPDGLELEVSQLAFDEFGIDVGTSAAAIQAVYEQFLAGGALPPSEMVDGLTLERLAREAERVTPRVPGDKEARPIVSRELGRSLPSPEMTEGDDPMAVMRSLG